MSDEQVSICRFCHAACPVSVTMEDRLPKVITGNRASPTYDGFCCTRGQAMVDLFRHPDRLLQSQKRIAEDTYVPISSDQITDEVAERVRAIVAEHGPSSVAVYFGTATAGYILAAGFASGWLLGLGSRQIYSSMTIDQPGKLVAASMLGGWEAGPHGFTGSDVWMIVGSNPAVTIGGTLPAPNSPRRLKDAVDKGLKLIVIDPRKTETARRAAIHLQPLPGHDAAIIGAMAKIIISRNLHDSAFLAENAEGLEKLYALVEQIDEAQVAKGAAIALDDLVAAAVMFASAHRGIATGSTGANMSGRATLTEYLIQSLNVLCGRYLRAGETLDNPGVLLPEAAPRAQPRAPVPPVDPTMPMSVRGLMASAAGLPTAALADEILNGNIKALFSVGGSPVVAFPDQDKTISALNALDLFVQIDVRMTPSARLADYILAPKITMETASCSYGIESLELYVGSWGMPEPFGIYAPALCDTPEGSDLLEEWEFFWGLGKKLDVPITLHRSESFTGPRRQRRAPGKIPMDRRPSTDEMLDVLTAESRIPLDELRKHRNGAVFPADVVVEPRSPDCSARFQLADQHMMDELEELLASIAGAEQGPPMGSHDFLLISRRAAHLNNSSGQDAPRLIRKGGSYNPAYLNPADLTDLKIESGDDIEIQSDHGSIMGVATVDETLRRGVVSMTHAYGKLPKDNADHRVVGSNTGRLVSVEDGYDRLSGIPRMSGIPVTVRAAVNA